MHCGGFTVSSVAPRCGTKVWHLTWMLRAGDYEGSRPTMRMEISSVSKCGTGVLRLMCVPSLLITSSELSSSARVITSVSLVHERTLRKFANALIGTASVCVGRAVATVFYQAIHPAHVRSACVHAWGEGGLNSPRPTEPLISTSC